MTMTTTKTLTTLASILLAGTTQAFQLRQPPPIDLVKGFDWKDPFSLEAMAAFQPSCEAKASFEALEYTLHELMEPPPQGLKPWAQGLKKSFTGREYPGGWSGLDHHLHGRSLLLMDYHKLPLSVREWIEEQERTDGDGKALFAILDKPKDDKYEIEQVVDFPAADKIDRSNDEQRVAIFAPGAIYGILPLWAAEGSECKDQLSDLTRYKTTPVDGGVAAWVEHSEPKDHKTEFNIRAQVLKASDAEIDQDKKSETHTASNRTRLVPGPPTGFSLAGRHGLVFSQAYLAIQGKMIKRSTNTDTAMWCILGTKQNDTGKSA
ncbi:hypothetical protein NM208_g14078 [Fusarium decemcellulare]|uniref:Uncharacterized protein n=1 Tax=Fusarium decemcellulare TaxID=57161 RepID=A0ACC1RJA2_9HYPO|nr:hypothetical protein NM208_g14078 [Fusarium decemcellulare]